MGVCLACRRVRKLCLSHAIPKSAFTPLMRSGNGSAIAIPKGDGNIHRTNDSGDAPLLCEECEAIFNTAFDGPLANALKKLSNEIWKNGHDAKIEFPADQAAHALVSIAWRICFSSASIYSQVKLDKRHLLEIHKLVGLPSTEILKHCTVGLKHLKGPKAESGGLGPLEMSQFIKSPEAYMLSIKPKRSPKYFAIDWTMFGFLVVVALPRLPYSKRSAFGAFKRGSLEIGATPVGLLEYGPLRNALFAGMTKDREGKVSSGISRR